MVKLENALNGMAQIADFLNRSAPTVLHLKQQYPNMPIRKVGNIWCGDKREIEEWWRLFTAGKEDEYSSLGSRGLGRGGGHSGRGPETSGRPANPGSHT